MHPGWRRSPIETRDACSLIWAQPMETASNGSCSWSEACRWPFCRAELSTLRPTTQLFPWPQTCSLLSRQGDYTPLASCPNGGKWEALLVEANPRFDSALHQVEAQHPNQVKAMPSSAAYMCDAQTSFYLDNVNTEHNYWGSSLSPSHQDVVKSGKVKVTVPTRNLLRILHEQTTAKDLVIVKMDIEGAEFDIIPCLANSPQVRLVDKLFMEVHDPSWGLVGNSEQEFRRAQASLRRQGVAIPAYNSPTLLQTFSQTGIAGRRGGLWGGRWGGLWKGLWGGLWRGLWGGRTINQIMVLTYAERTRAYHYEEVFPDIRVSWMVGLTAAHFANEQDMMDREELVPMTEQMKAQWRSNPNREADRKAGTPPLGTLACALAHYKAWQTAAASLSGREWLVILEDDAQPETTSDELLRDLSGIAPDVELVFLGERHCPHGYGSTAYAITAKGAQALLDTPFMYNADFYLDVPKIKRECLAPHFRHQPTEANGTSMTKLLARPSTSS
ncbi:unnamed protein product [Symbiodinium natans]|uniref:Methyltransferase FkbM domain-containing protein n=1 Tax=Symbiodinium natans TaxID=878477 RepID=A0A812I6L9_9DINO|nr:unnamed protein product [Symbiodinium natans]